MMLWVKPLEGQRLEFGDQIACSTGFGGTIARFDNIDYVTGVFGRGYRLLTAAYPVYELHNVLKYMGLGHSGMQIVYVRRVLSFTFHISVSKSGAYD